MKYYVKSLKETPDDAVELEYEDYEIDFETAAEVAAEDLMDNGGGEDLPWPLDITIIDDDGNEHVFEVSMDFEPVFSAKEKNDHKDNSGE